MRSFIHTMHTYMYVLRYVICMYVYVYKLAWNAFVYTQKKKYIHNTLRIYDLGGKTQQLCSPEKNKKTKTKNLIGTMLLVCIWMRLSLNEIKMFFVWKCCRMCDWLAMAVWERCSKIRKKNDKISNAMRVGITMKYKCLDFVLETYKSCIYVGLYIHIMYAPTKHNINNMIKWK